MPTRRSPSQRSDRRNRITQLLREREQSGESYRLLSERSGIPAPTLASWQSRLRKEAETTADDLELIELAAPVAAVASSNIEIRFASGLSIHVPAQFDPDELATILELVADRC